MHTSQVCQLYQIRGVVDDWRQGCIQSDLNKITLKGTNLELLGIRCGHNDLSTAEGYQVGWNT